MMTDDASIYSVTVVASRLNWLLLPVTVLGAMILQTDLTRWWLEVRHAESGALAARIGRVGDGYDAHGLADLVRSRSRELAQPDFLRYLHTLENGSPSKGQPEFTHRSPWTTLRMTETSWLVCPIPC